jgi:hypothetical protein
MQVGKSRVLEKAADFQIRTPLAFQGGRLSHFEQSQSDF